MLILKRFVGESILVGDGKDRFEIVVDSTASPDAVLYVAGRQQQVSEGGRVSVPCDARGELLVTVERVRCQWVRLGFQGDPARRIVRAELHDALEVAC